MSTSTPEKHEFQAEVRQLLDIVIHSLYTDREIFLRELISNASDSLEKLRHQQLTEDNIFDDKLDLEINITTDDTAGTVTIQDFGIGMSREELNQNLGTIAHSGTKAFLKAIEEGEKPSANLIGQFGVGFYSAFMVADEVKVYTHSWREGDEHLLWTSGGAGDYSIEDSEGQRRGCKIVLKLKEDAKDFSKADTIQSIIERYSSFVPFPINLNGERINKVDAVWLKPKSEITEEQYLEFYKFQAKAFDEPIFRLHFSADAPLAINALLFSPGTNQEQWGMRLEPGVSLYCKNVLIDPKPEGLLPEWMRFARGVIDSADLPLNISRESMQDSALVQKLSKVITKRFLKMLDEESSKDPEKYETFYKQFSPFLKEGVATDFNYREPLGKLLRYESSRTEAGKTTSLADYVSRMGEEQKEIYYLHASNREAIESGPYLEAFKARDIEVLYLFESADEFVMSHLGTFDEKRLTSADQAEVELDDYTPEGAGEPLSEDDSKALGEWMSGVLGESAGEVKTGKRLVESPIVALNPDRMMTPNMKQFLKHMQPEGMPMESKLDLEINPRHPLIHGLNRLRSENSEQAELICRQLHTNALMAAGLVEDPRTVVNRMNEVLEALTKK